ncbi:signal peptide peptidase SppA [Metabacillus idriensis]|uniref:Signal peptide peptidase SppA n=1 Tax=Metabacillus idriensis TaxID=324768 RepID=A0A6I2MG20_9BACI|nr:signal peptide peptidase SppA [Metabacillus idriensis]MCM3596535.1 signal peptide peptidase SppA [Metabacillus idriensis]MRX55381.1 signal peptide peptidase SppA [Metabacillus idriensis]OHR68239.1 signal peptide peptidase SppA [Bacillus sp. HMSC76G11]
MNGKRWGALVIAAVLFGISVVVSLTNMALANSNAFTNALTANEEFTETVLEPGNESKKIVVLEVNGVIQDTGENVTSFFETAGYQHQQFLDMIDAAAKDKSVRGIMLKVNSPGGGVVESAEIHKHLIEAKEKHKKKIYVSMGTTAASGGYYISAPADKIYAAPDTLTGSLGVIMQGINYSGLAEKYGVKFETVKSGEFKDIMSPAREMTPEDRDILQTMVNNAYQGFVDVIADGRGLSDGEVRKLADGRIYDGRQAKELNLIDELGYSDDALKGMKKDLKIEGAHVVEYETSAGLDSLLALGANKVFSEEFELMGLYRFFSQSNSPRMMYLYSE